MSQRIPRLVYTGEGGNLFTLTWPEGQARQLTWSWENKGQKSRAQQASARLTHVWPAWAPDGSRVACFGLWKTAEQTLATSVYTVSADGVESWELAHLSGGVPIYGNWSPRADAFAMLVQRGERRLSLEIVHLSRPGTVTSLVSGAPLFWSWSPRGDVLAAHVGSGLRASAPARVLVFDTLSGEIVREVSARPGDFRVPSWSPREDLLAYVEKGEGNQNTLFLLDVRTGEKGPVTAVPGNLASLWSADGRFLAFADTSHPESAIFSRVKVLDLESGRISVLLDKALTSFFWFPQGDALLYLAVETQRHHLSWHRISRTGRETKELARFLPTREQTFIASFFDQYAPSHPPLAPDGSALAFAGFLVGTDSSETTTTAQVYLLPLDRPAVPIPVAPGNFGCWSL